MSPQVLEKFMQDVTAGRFREAIHGTPPQASSRPFTLSNECGRAAESAVQRAEHSQNWLICAQTTASTPRSVASDSAIANPAT
jgi:hypothetical protein